MARRITLLLLLMIGFSTIGKSQVRDSVYISLPYGMDTTCDSTQLMFTATESNDTFSNVQYHWFTDNLFTGVTIDTFLTTALASGDSVYCDIVFTNSFGALDSFKSNTIIIYHADSIQPRVEISLIVGSNPDCSGHPLTFIAYPVNGGTSPSFQWMVDDTAISGEDSATITRYFNNNDTVTCRMVSNSECLGTFLNIDTSNAIIVSHDSLNALVSIYATGNPICVGTPDTFMATVSSAGVGATLSWYVDSTLIPTALGPDYYTSTLTNGDYIYAVLNAPDPCVISHSTVSNVITMTVISLLPNSAWTSMTSGVNPGCLDSPITLTGYYLNFGTSPDYNWYVNGILALSNSTTFTNTFSNGDVVTFRVSETDNGCYNFDSITTPGVLMIRDTTPSTPWLSLIGDLLVVNSSGSGTYNWYYDSASAYTGTLDNPLGHSALVNPHSCGYYYVVKDSGYCSSLPSNIIYICLLGVPNVLSADMKIYPNPTTGIMNIDWGSQVTGDLKMEVYDMLGHILHSEDIGNTTHHQSDLSNLPEGNYVMVLSDQDGDKATYKIVIAR